MSTIRTVIKFVISNPGSEAFSLEALKAKDVQSLPSCAELCDAEAFVLPPFHYSLLKS